MNCTKARPVLKYDSDGVYKRKYRSEYEAAKKLGIDRSSICKALKKGHKAGGYYWRYDDGDHKIRIVIKRREGRKVSIFNAQGLYITTVDSIAQASQLTHIPESTIKAHLDRSLLKNSSFTFKEVEK